MKLIACSAALLMVLASVPASTHHSYAAYHTDRVIELDGVVEAFEWIAPHSLLKVRTSERVYTVEWRAAAGLARSGIRSDAFKAGDRIIVQGNPRRDIEESGVVNLTAVRRVSDGWSWSARPVSK